MPDTLPATALPSIPAELEKAVAATGLAADGIHALKTEFAPHFIRFQELAELAKGIPVNAPKAARTLRLELKAIRVAADKTREELKADSLRRGRAIDGINAVLTFQLVPIEKAMQEIEEAEEIAERKRVAALIERRKEALRPYVIDAGMYNLGGCSEEAFEELLRVSKVVREQEIAAEQKARDDAIARQKAEAEQKAKREADLAAERARMQAENERLAKIAAEERKAREESEKAAAVEREKARKKQEAADAEHRKELARLEKMAAEQLAERDRVAAEQRKRDQVAADEKAKAAKAAKKAAAAPDQKKVALLAETLRSIKLPELSTAEGRALSLRIAEQVSKFTTWLEAEAEKL